MAMASSSSATVAVDKATSDLLITPDWTMNIDICDSINSNHWQAKDVVKAVKKRLQHRNPRVQLLALTLLETMVKNCGDFVHFQIADKNILGEMVKIVKKKTDMLVRDKILVLLDSWQEAFGGPGGKYPQYYWAYEDLRRSGVQFPPRSIDAAPIFTPPLAHSTLRHAQPGFGMPGGSSRRLDETMATEIESLSLSSLESMRNVMDLLVDMLQAVSPDDREAVKDEVIVDLVEHCRSNQKKLMQMLTTTGDEEVLVRGLELNDGLQVLLAKHDAIASGLPMPTPVSDFSSKQPEGSSSNTKPTEVNNSPPAPSTKPIPQVSNVSKTHVDEEDEEEEDDFAQLARRHSKSQPCPPDLSNGSCGALVPIETDQISSAPASSLPAQTSTALAIVDPVKNTQEQDIIDLLSITLSTSFASPQPTPSQTPPIADQSIPQIPVSSSATQQAYPGTQGSTSYDSYVVPWAQSQPQHYSQQPQAPLSSQPQPRPLYPHQQQQQFHPQQHAQYPQYSSAYPPPPWAATPGYANGSSSQNYMPAAHNTFAAPHGNTVLAPQTVATQMQNHSSSAGSNGAPLNGDFGARMMPAAQPAAQKPFVPSYRLFEDLNVLGNAEGKFKVSGSAAPSFSSSSGPSMVGGRK